MDKPFGILVIVLAMFVTIGALATSSFTPGSDEERGAVRADLSRRFLLGLYAQQSRPNFSPAPSEFQLRQEQSSQ